MEEDEEEGGITGEVGITGEGGEGGRVKESKGESEGTKSES